MPQRAHRVAVAEGGIDRRPRGVQPGGGLAAAVGEPERVLALVVEGLDEALVLQLVQRGVDRARAGAPQALGSLGEGLHHLVAVHRLLGEQGQDRLADLAAAVASATPAGAEGAAGHPAWAAGEGAGSEAGGAERAGTGEAAGAAAATASMAALGRAALPFVMVVHGCLLVGWMT